MLAQSVLQTEDDGAEIFHACPFSENCPTCQRLSSCGWEFVEAVYCISLRDRADRAENAARELHRAGLCHKTVFFRPIRPTRGMVSVAIWESHKAVARHALAQGYGNALIFEDDVTFVSSRKHPAKALRAFRALPPDWLGLYFGHWPTEGFFVAPFLLRVHSGCTHAYLASSALLRKIAHSEPPPPGGTCHPIVGRGIDGMLACLDGMYAVFPMIAGQAHFSSDNLSTRYARSGTKRPIMDIFRYRAIVIVYGMRAAELLCVLLSPLHWLRSQIRRKSDR